MNSHDKNIPLVSNKSKNEMQILEWVELQKDIDEYKENSETFFQKAKRKTIQNPIAPIGLLATSGFLFFGLRALRRGDSRKQQYMMRGRVVSQAIGVISIMATLMLTRDT